MRAGSASFAGRPSPSRQFPSSSPIVESAPWYRFIAVTFVIESRAAARRPRIAVNVNSRRAIFGTDLGRAD